MKIKQEKIDIIIYAFIMTAIIYAIAVITLYVNNEATYNKIF